MRRADYDVIIISDLRFPGGTSSAIVEEVKAQTAAGYTTALIHVPSPANRTERPFSGRVVELVQSGMVDLVTEDRPLTARLLEIRHPSVFESIPPRLPRVEADIKLIVASSAPFNRDRSEVYYDVYDVRRNVQKLFGEEVPWLPVGPLVRESLLESGWKLNLAQDDWHEIINADEWQADRSRYAADRPVIGRHSRPGAEKWPKSATEILAAYPEDERFVVRILGGAEVPLSILGRIPDNWEVRDFGSVPPAAFLQEIDFFVYFHHPAWLEAFGRTILEAIASGAPAIVPPHFRSLFQEACIYAKPAEVAEIVSRMYGDRKAYLEQSERGARAARERFGWETHARRLEKLIGAPSRPPRRIRLARPQKKRAVLFVASNGAGMGHLSRTIAIARRLLPDTLPVFLTMSQALRAIREHGFLAEFVLPREYLPEPAGLTDKETAKSKKQVYTWWHQFLEARARHILDVYDPLAVVIDGTSIYEGLQAVMQADLKRPYLWCRRAMWKRSAGDKLIAQAQDFDAIIEPGELAEAADIGWTVPRRQEVAKVGPILALDESELLDKAEARQALGLEPDQLAVLIQLGAGNINDTTTPANIVIRRLAQWANLQIVLSEPMISIESVAVPPQVKKVTIYPISKYYRAFDFVVSASGYNSYHELIAFAIPTIFVPNMETSLDDQAARARYAQEVGAALCLEAVTEEDVDRCVKVMLDRDKRAAMAARCREVFPGNGADAAAKVIRDIMDRWPRLRKARPREGTLRAAQGRLDAAANVAPPAPAGPQGARRANWQSLALRTRHRLGAVRRLLWRCARRAKWAFRVFLHGPFPEKRRLVAPIPLLVMAWGLSDEELEQAVERVRRLEVMIREFTPIFVTDSDACHILRRYRHLFEYIPPETEWNKYHPEGTWAEFRDKRIRHILEIYRPAKILVVEDKSGFEAMEKGLLNVLLQQGE